jgi:hypothetical protein
MTKRTTLAEIFRAAGKAHHHEQDTLSAEFRAADAEMRARAPSADRTLSYANWFLTRRVA